MYIRSSCAYHAWVIQLNRVSARIVVIWYVAIVNVRALIVIIWTILNKTSSCSMIISKMPHTAYSSSKDLVVRKTMKVTNQAKWKPLAIKRWFSTSKIVSSTGIYRVLSDVILCLDFRKRTLNDILRRTVLMAKSGVNTATWFSTALAKITTR